MGHRGVEQHLVGSDRPARRRGRSCSRPRARAPSAARRSASRPTRSTRGITRSAPTARPPSARIGASAFLRCWVEPIRLVAPFKMMPTVRVAMRNSEAPVCLRRPYPEEATESGLPDFSTGRRNRQHGWPSRMAPHAAACGYPSRRVLRTLLRMRFEMGRFNPRSELDEYTLIAQCYSRARSSARDGSLPRHIVCLTFDFDTMSGFIARGLTTPTPLSRGEFGARASARILDMLERRGIRATWFTPGFTIETFPRECEAVVKAATRSPITAGPMCRRPSRAARPRRPTSCAPTRRSCASRAKRRAATARRPGTSPPTPSTSWSPTASSMISSLMGADYWPYRARRGDVAKLGEPYRFGEETALIEMPISWSLDDFPHFEFMRTRPDRAARPAARPRGDG